LYCFGGFCSEAQSSGTLSREQSESFLGQASAFLTACALEQIRLAAEKCKFELRLDYSRVSEFHRPPLLWEDSGRDVRVLE
jgi:hypothetical protein